MHFCQLREELTFNKEKAINKIVCNINNKDGIHTFE